MTRRRARPWLDGGDATIRRARAGDVTSLRSLAALAEAPPLAGDVIVAEVGGELRAAPALADGRTIADPFRPTATARALLDVRYRNLAEAHGLAPAARRVPLRRLRRRTA